MRIEAILNSAKALGWRSGEVRGARWDEVDLDKAIWVVPAERMKAKREHRVPLSKAAVSVLESMPRISGCQLTFPGTKRQSLSDMSLSSVLQRKNLKQFTVHGFRSTFRDWAAERGIAFDAIESALAHQIGNRVMMAYLRTDHLDTWRDIMTKLTDFLSGGVASSVQLSA